MSDVDVKLLQIKRKHSNGFYRPGVREDIEFLLDMLELKESEYQSAVDKCNKSSQIAREYQKENYRLLEEVDIWKHRHDQYEEETEKYIDREQRLIEGLRDISAESSDYESRYIADRLLKEIGVTVE